jgi:branched-chain amino acid transport system substrate-binding protein
LHANHLNIYNILGAVLKPNTVLKGGEKVRKCKSHLQKTKIVQRKEEKKMLSKIQKTIVILCVVLLMSSVASLKSSAAVKPKTLKIGVIVFMGWSLGADMVRGIEIMAENVNKKGGLAVGNERYNIELIKYDSKFVPETARAAAERLVYQDKVKFIVGDETIDAWLSVTEQNKVLVVAILSSPTIFNPKNKYLFQGTYLQTQMPTAWGWFAKNHPQVKNSMHVFPDNKIGQIRSGLAKKHAAIFGPAMPDDYLLFYPPEATDMSVVGTKAKTLNPDGFTATGGGIQGDALCYKAAWQAGYKGTIWSFVGVSEEMFGRIVPLECIEGLVSPQYFTEMESPPPVTKEFKDAWIAKYGKWESPSVSFSDAFIIMTAGIEQANSLDPDTVAEVMGNGMRFEGIMGHGKMISRPDVGNPRTVDALYGQIIKKTVGGKPEVLAKLTPEDAYEFNKVFWGWK